MGDEALEPSGHCGERESGSEVVDGLSDVVQPGRVLGVVVQGGQDGPGKRAGEDADLEVTGGAAKPPGDGPREQFDGAPDVVELRNAQFGNGGDELSALLLVVAFQLCQSVPDGPMERGEHR